MLLATITSRILRSKVRLSPTSRFFATCWVMVEPPWRLSPPSVVMKARVTLRHVDAPVLEEALVLGRDERLLHELRNLGQRHPVPAAVGLEQLGEFRPVPSSTVVMPGNLRPLSLLWSGRSAAARL